MPNAATHDLITLAVTPAVWGTTYALTDWRKATVAACACAFAGFMFNGDLDIHSEPYKRWGPARVIWLPYQKSIPHRSWLSHGPVAGTVLRLAWVVICVVPLVVIALTLGWLDSVAMLAWGREHWAGIAAGFAGLEAGAMGHSLADWVW